MFFTETIWYADMSKRWQDWMIMLLGCWLLVSPSTLGYVPSHAVTGNAYGIGVALITFNIIAVGRIVDIGQELFNIVIGCWLLASPYALAFHGSGNPEYNASAVGAAVIVLAAWQIHDAVKPP